MYPAYYQKVAGEPAGMEGECMCRLVNNLFKVA